MYSQTLLAALFISGWVNHFNRPCRHHSHGCSSYEITCVTVLQKTLSSLNSFK